MNETAVKNNKPESRRAIITAASVAAAVLVIAILFLVFRNALTFRLAERYAQSGNFAAAGFYAGRAGGDIRGSEALKDYVELRLEINAKYPSLIAEFDYDRILDWNERAQTAKLNSEGLSQDVKDEIDHLSAVLSGICSLNGEFSTIRPDIIELMGVFDEINRLYTKDENGLNTAFTINEEKRKISRWNTLLDEVQAYMEKLPSGEKVYLLNYLIKEARGEINDLTKNMDNLLENSGITEFDPVRAEGGGGTKKYPSVQSSGGKTVNFRDKEEYVEYMYANICRNLTETLGEYYKGI